MRVVKDGPAASLSSGRWSISGILII